MNCSVCQNQGHISRRCPELYGPLQPGFHSGGNGGGGHDHDEEHVSARNESRSCIGTDTRCPAKLRNSKPHEWFYSELWSRYTPPLSEEEQAQPTPPPAPRESSDANSVL